MLVFGGGVYFLLGCDGNWLDKLWGGHCFHLFIFTKLAQASIEFVLDFIHFSHNSHGTKCGLLSSDAVAIELYICM